MRVVAYITTNFAPIIIGEHLFFQWLCQHLVDVQNGHMYESSVSPELVVYQNSLLT